jgi:hypothetical protein
MLSAAFCGAEHMTDENFQGCRPRAVAMIICDLVLHDERTRNASLIGLFNEIRGQRLPMLHDRLHVFISLTDGHGRLPFTLQCKTPDDTVIWRNQGEIAFASPLDVQNVDIEIRGLVLPVDGIYTFEFDCGGEVALRRFAVMAGPPAPPPDTDASSEN